MKIKKGFLNWLFKPKRNSIGYKKVGTASYKDVKNSFFEYEGMIFVKQSGSGKMIKDLTTTFSEYVKAFPEKAELRPDEIGKLEVNLIQLF